MLRVTSLGYFFQKILNKKENKQKIDGDAQS